jgi:hypothetical protein
LGAVLVGDRLWVWRGADSLKSVDPATGDVIRQVDSPIDEPSQLLDLGNDLVGVVSRTEFAAINSDGQVHLRRIWPAPLVDVARFELGVLLVGAYDRAITTYSIETSSTAGAVP